MAGRSRKIERAPVDEPLRDVIVADLLELRKQPGALRESRLTGLPHLTEYLGSGSEAQAYSELLRLRRRHGRETGTDIHAFFYTAGHGVGGQSLAQRLKRYAADFHVDDRTALRRSDRGVQALSYLIRDRNDYARPWGVLIALQSGSQVLLDVGVYVWEYTSYRRPRVSVNGERLDGLAFDLDEYEPGKLRASEKIEDLPLATSNEGGKPLLEVVVQWPLPVWPLWMVSTHLCDIRLQDRLAVMPNGKAELDIRWYLDHDPNPDVPLAIHPDWLK